MITVRAKCAKVYNLLQQSAFGAKTALALLDVQGRDHHQLLQKQIHIAGQTSQQHH